MKTSIFISFTKYGLHRWPDCNIEKVSFLALEHGHTFHFKLWFGVNDLDREIEFFDMKDEVISYLESQFKSDRLPAHILDFGAFSCERLAAVLLEKFNAVKVEVSEDGLDGAVVEREY